MKAAARCTVVMLFVALNPATGSGQDQPSVATVQVNPEARKAALRRLRQTAVIRVDPRVIKTLPPTTAPAPAPPPAGPPVEVPPPPVEAPPPNPVPTEVVQTVNRGELLYVPLEKPDEQKVQQILSAHVAKTDPQHQVSLYSFQGALRQLAKDDVEVQLKPYVLVGQPLQYVPTKRQFEGTVVIGVANLQDDAGGRSLSVPLRFEVLESALAQPASISIDETSPPYKRISVVSQVIDRPVILHIASNFSHEGVEIAIPIEPTLLVDIDGDNLRALGMQTTEVTVRAVGSAKPPTGNVTLRAPGAYLVNGAKAPFDAEGVARAVIRTDRTGLVTVTATATGFARGEQAVTVVWPWQTLLTACIGGLIGGFIRLATRIRKGMSGVQFAVGLTTSVFVGVLVFALYMVGVKLLPVTFSVETGDLFAFAASALAGSIGASVLKPGPS